MKSSQKDKRNKRKKKHSISKITLTARLKNFYVKPINNMLFKFFALICIFYALWITPFFQQYIVANVAIFYAQISSLFLGIFQLPVKAVGDSLTSTNFSMSIKNGCDAIEAIAILLCAMAIYPSSFKSKSIGLFVGLVLLILLNIIRIVSLYFIGVYIPSLFEVMHVSVWQVLFIAFPILIILRWISWTKKIELV